MCPLDASHHTRELTGENRRLCLLSLIHQFSKPAISCFKPKTISSAIAEGWSPYGHCTFPSSFCALLLLLTFDKIRKFFGIQVWQRHATGLCVSRLICDSNNKLQAARDGHRFPITRIHFANESTQQLKTLEWASKASFNTNKSSNKLTETWIFRSSRGRLACWLSRQVGIYLNGVHSSSCRTRWTICSWLSLPDVNIIVS